MSFNTIGKTLSLVYGLFNPETPNLGVIPFTPQKTHFAEGPITNPLPRSTPEAQGIPSTTIANYLRALYDDPTLNTHLIMVVRHGHVVVEAEFGSHLINVQRTTFSACKSITSMAIGALITDGKLSIKDNVVDILKESIAPLDQVRFKDLTVEDLLTMRSTITFSESTAMVETDWVHNCFSMPSKGKIGETFNYNSLNTYLLSAIVKAKTQQGLYDYLNGRIFNELCITDVVWEKCPKGIEKGGWGLYIRPEDLAKLGMLAMHYGRYNGKQLISEEYMRAATTAHAKASESFGRSDYGYQFWCSRKENMFMFNGMFGQNVICFPEQDIVVVTGAGNNEFFQQSNLYATTVDYFCQSFEEKLNKNASAQKVLINVLKQITIATPGLGYLPEKSQTEHLKEKLTELTKDVFSCADENAASTSLFPVLLATTQNNYGSGVESITSKAALLPSLSMSGINY